MIISLSSPQLSGIISNNGAAFSTMVLPVIAINPASKPLYKSGEYLVIVWYV